MPERGGGMHISSRLRAHVGWFPQHPDNIQMAFFYGLLLFYAGEEEEEDEGEEPLLLFQMVTFLMRKVLMAINWLCDAVFSFCGGISILGMFDYHSYVESCCDRKLRVMRV